MVAGLFWEVVWTANSQAQNCEREQTKTMNIFTIFFHKEPIDCLFVQGDVSFKKTISQKITNISKYCKKIHQRFQDNTWTIVFFTSFWKLKWFSFISSSSDSTFCSWFQNITFYIQELSVICWCHHY